MRSTKERNSNFELLRIIAMLFIIFHHSVVHGLLNNNTSIGGWTPVATKVWLTTFTGQMVATLGKVAVGIFVMISGYFLVNSSINGKKSFKKILMLVVQVYLYSIIIYFVAVHFKWVNPKSTIVLQQTFLPLFYNSCWFVSEYILLYLVYPYINVALHNITRQQYRNLIIIIAITFTLVPTLIPNFGSYGWYGQLVVFILYYLIGGYIRLYGTKHECLLGTFLTIAGAALMAVVIFYYDYMGATTHNQQFYHNSFINITGQFSPSIVLMATGIILLFKNMHLGHNRLINTIAATTFGVYLIHDNPIMEQMIWLKWLKMPALLVPNVKHYLITAVIVCPLIFIICSLIDYVRILIFNAISFIFSKFSRSK